MQVVRLPYIPPAEGAYKDSVKNYFKSHQEEFAEFFCKFGEALNQAIQEGQRRLFIDIPLSLYPIVSAILISKGYKVDSGLRTKHNLEKAQYENIDISWDGACTLNFLLP